VKSWFQILLSKFNLYRYSVGQVGINVPIPVPLPFFSFTGSRGGAVHVVNECSLPMSLKAPGFGHRLLHGFLQEAAGANKSRCTTTSERATHLGAGGGIFGFTLEPRQ
jgi:hypothetical protein